MRQLLPDPADFAKAALDTHGPAPSLLLPSAPWAKTCSRLTPCSDQPAGNKRQSPRCSPRAAANAPAARAMVAPGGSVGEQCADHLPQLAGIGDPAARRRSLASAVAWAKLNVWGRPEPAAAGCRLDRFCPQGQQAPPDEGQVRRAVVRRHLPMLSPSQTRVPASGKPALPPVNPAGARHQGGDGVEALGWRGTRMSSTSSGTCCRASRTRASSPSPRAGGEPDRAVAQGLAPSPPRASFSAGGATSN